MKEMKSLKDFNDMDQIFCYFYTTLNEKEQRIYEKLAEGMFSYRPVITIWGASQEDISRVYDKLMQDMPALFFQEGLQVVQYPAIQMSRVSPQYRFPKADAENIMAQILQKVQPLLQQCQGKSELECEILVHDYLYNNVIYDDNYALHMGGSSFEIAAPLLWGRGVCSGISKSAKFIFDLLGMKSLLLLGKVAEGADADDSSHMWNMVKIGSERFHLDITFNITTRSRRYFNMTDQQILADRILI